MKTVQLLFVPYFYDLFAGDRIAEIGFPTSEMPLGDACSISVSGQSLAALIRSVPFGRDKRIDLYKFT